MKSRLDCGVAPILLVLLVLASLVSRDARRALAGLSVVDGDGWTDC